MTGDTSRAAAATAVADVTTGGRSHMQQPRRVLVLGAAGFIGRNVVAHILSTKGAPGVTLIRACDKLVRAAPHIHVCVIMCPVLLLHVNTAHVLCEDNLLATITTLLSYR